MPRLDYVLHEGDCLEVMRGLVDNSIDAVVTDPPYHLTSIVKRFGATSIDGDGTNERRAKAGADGMARLSRGFMGKQWDGGDIAFRVELWSEVLRVLKPGGHIAAFSGTRTYHRMACAIEDAGFEIRDQLAWVYGSGFPKSHDVSKGIDKAFEAAGTYGAPKSLAHAGWCERGAMRGDNGHEGYQRPWMQDEDAVNRAARIYEPATDAAKQWQGWGTALKPSYEPLCLARKPLTPQQEISILAPTIWELVCKVVSFGKMDTPLSEPPRESGFLSIAISLSECLGVLWENGSKFTTETALGLTTDLKILRSLLLRIMQGFTIEGQSQTNGGASDAALAEAISKSVFAKCEKLTLTTAGEIVIDWLAQEGSGPEGRRLSPNWEPICLARKPLSEPNIAANVLRWGTGAINVDATRVAHDEPCKPMAAQSGGDKVYGQSGRHEATTDLKPSGRWPANLCHDGSQEVLDLFPAQAGGKDGRIGIEPGRRPGGFGNVGHERGEDRPNGQLYDDSSSAARFFYCAKADADNRLASKHPTVKPVALMQWLCRLVTPSNGVILDPFAGSGSTAEAAWREGFASIMIERDPAYCKDIASRMAHVLASKRERQQTIVVGKGRDTPIGGLFGQTAG